MSDSLEFWVFILANTGVVLGAGLLAALSYLAYRRGNVQPSYRYATIGFGLIALGGFVDPAYLVMFAVEFHLSLTEHLFISVSEDLLLASGLGLLFYAITQYDAEATSTVDGQSTPTSIDASWRHE